MIAAFRCVNLDWPLIGRGKTVQAACGAAVVRYRVPTDYRGLNDAKGQRSGSAERMLAVETIR